MPECDAVVIGSGPNGLAAAVTLARAGLAVRVYERNSRYGGGLRTQELTLPGFQHDVYSAVHPLVSGSAFFRDFGLSDRVRFATPPISYGHPLDNGRAALAYRDLAETAAALGIDGSRWRALLAPLVSHVSEISQFTGNRLVRFPEHPRTALRFSTAALRQGGGWWTTFFRTDEAAALFTGVMAHSGLPLPSVAGAAAGLTLAVHAHAAGWPIPLGGSNVIADSLVADLEAHGGEVITGCDVTNLDELPRARAILFDTHVVRAAQLAEPRLKKNYLRRVAHTRSGIGVFKMDFALSGPVPWTHPELLLTATVHVGGTRAEIAGFERTTWGGAFSDTPYVLVAQPSLFDPSRAPLGHHTLWAYTHVPHGSHADRSDAVIRAIERFAPGFRDRIMTSTVRTPLDLEADNPNYRGGDIAAGAPTLRQLVARPVFGAEPWRMPGDGLYLASSSATPGPGVHGLAGYFAALSALRYEFGIRTSPSLAPND